MLLGWLHRFTPLHEARSTEEREAIYRFRYSVYGSELRRDYTGMDHERQRLAQPEDEEPSARLYYTGSPAEVTGTVRVRIWDQPPDDIVEELSLDRLPKGHRVAYVERLMVRPTARGQLLLPAILWHGYEYMLREGVEVCLLTCVPGLMRHYVGLGARTYGVSLVEGASSAEVPLIILLHDVEHLRRVRSFILPLVRRRARPFDTAPFAPLFAPAAQPLCFDEREVIRAIEAARPPIFDGLPARALRRIARRAFLLDVPAGGVVVRRGTVDREMFVVLSGELEVATPASVRIGAGAPVGEVAFLGTPGLRTATVHARERSRLLVLRRRFLDELARHEPIAAYRVARALARLVADRFSDSMARAVTPSDRVAATGT